MPCTCKEWDLLWAPDEITPNQTIPCNLGIGPTPPFDSQEGQHEPTKVLRNRFSPSHTLPHHSPPHPDQPKPGLVIRGSNPCSYSIRYGSEDVNARYVAKMLTQDFLSPSSKTLDDLSRCFCFSPNSLLLRFLLLQKRTGRMLASVHASTCLPVCAFISSPVLCLCPDADWAKNSAAFGEAGLHSNSQSPPGAPLEAWLPEGDQSDSRISGSIQTCLLGTNPAPQALQSRSLHAEVQNGRLGNHSLSSCLSLSISLDTFLDTTAWQQQCASCGFLRFNKNVTNDALMNLARIALLHVCCWRASRLAAGALPALRLRGVCGYACFSCLLACLALPCLCLCLAFAFAFAFAFALLALLFFSLLCFALLCLLLLVCFFFSA